MRRGNPDISPGSPRPAKGAGLAMTNYVINHTLKGLIMRRLSLGFSFFFTCLLVSLSANAQSTQALFHQAGDPIVGNTYGNVTLVEFLDYQCSHCIEMTPVVETLIRNNTNLRVVYKLLPIRGPQSEQATKAALAANTLGKFKEFNHSLLTSNQPLSNDVIFNLAKSNGLNVDTLKKGMKAASVTSNIDSNMKLATDLAIPGTPAFFIGKTNATDLNNVTPIIGSAPEEKLQDAINAAGK